MRVPLALVVAMTVVGVACAKPMPEVDKSIAVKQAIAEYYTAYSGRDMNQYRALLTDDYVLVENGQAIDREHELAAMSTTAAPSSRTDAFDFRVVNVHDNEATAVYFLRSQIVDEKGARSPQWLESAVLRKAPTGWKMALLHSTTIESGKAP